MADTTGATVWDYRIRRMEITWELAQAIVGASGPTQKSRNTRFEDALRDAQRIVDEVIPNGFQVRREE